MHPIIDERASDEQRDALSYIMSGEDQPVGTMFQIFSVIIETIKEPLFAPITFDWDLDERNAKIELPEAVRAQSEPIRNPVTDAEHRAESVLANPNGGQDREIAHLPSPGAFEHHRVQVHGRIRTLDRPVAPILDMAVNPMGLTGYPRTVLLSDLVRFPPVLAGELE